MEFWLRAVSLPTAARRLGVLVEQVDQTNKPMNRDPNLSSKSQDLEILIGDISALMIRWPFGDTCLRRSLLFARRTKGYSPKVIFGVASRGGKIVGHAWVEHDLGTYLYNELADDDIVRLHGHGFTRQSGDM